MEPNFSFGYWLRRQRLAHDLRQAELARQIGVAAITLRKIEADERRPSLQVADRIATAFGLGPIERQTLLRVVRAELGPTALALPSRGAAGPREPAAHPRLRDPRPLHNLPREERALIGREAELAAIGAALARRETRLLTLTGPGGSGKTSLALAAAAGARQAFAHGVWFVDLAPVRDPELIVPMIAQAIGIAADSGRGIAAALRDALRGRELLLVLDNFEQLIVAAPLLTQLLADAPWLVLLVTSRERLGLGGEQVFAVPPLASPEPGRALSAREALGYPAVRLFVERVQAARIGFTLSDADVMAVTAICAWCDGLPLAIELVAARVQLFGLNQLLTRFERRLHTLPGIPDGLPPRQQTLRSVIAWSYALLSGEERQHFQRLGVFVGGCTPGAAERVLCADDTAGALAALVDKSLLVARAELRAEPRFVMLETIREYALEQLAARGGETAARDAHAAHFQELAELAAPEFRGQRAAAWNALLLADHDNLRAALIWLLASGAREAFVRLCAALWRFWWAGSFWQEGRRWLDQALAVLPPDGDELLRAQVLLGAGWLQVGTSDFAGAALLLDECLGVFGQAGAGIETADSLFALARVAYGLSDPALATTRMRAANAAYRAAGEQYGAAETLEELGYLCYVQGDLAGAQAASEEALALARGLAHARIEASALGQLGLLATLRGDLVAAEQLLGESLALQRPTGDAHSISDALNYLGLLAMQQGDATCAEGYWSEALGLRRDLGDQRGVSAIIMNLSAAALQRQDIALATARCVESLTLSGNLGYTQGLADGLLMSAKIHEARGQRVQAARLLGAADALRARQRLVLWPELARDTDWLHARLRAALGDDAWARAFEAGQALSLEAALVEAQRSATDQSADGVRLGAH